MAPIKFEENCKEKLEERRIQPSANAWEQLSDDLDNSESKNRRGFIFYIGIAASVIGVLLVAVNVFNSADDQMSSPAFVDTDNSANNASQRKTYEVLNSKKSQVEGAVEVSKKNKHDTNTVYNSKVTQRVVEKDTKLVSASNQIDTNLTVNQLVKRVHDSINNTPDTRKLVMTVNSKSDTTAGSVSKRSTFEDSKAMEVVDQIKQLKIKNGSVSDAEIENLLKQAHKDILRAQLYDKVTRTVDANALLQDVEEDLEQSFRNKVFDGLKSGFRTIKTAVAERNN